MSSYFILVVSICFYSLLLRYKRGNRYFLLLSGVHLLLYYLLRHPYVYPDNRSYAEAYMQISQLDYVTSLLYRWEFGYITLNWILTRFSDNPQTLFTVTSLIYVGCLMWLVKHWSSMPQLTLLVFLTYPMLFFPSLFVLRQHLVCMFALLGIYFFDKKWKSFFFSV